MEEIWKEIDGFDGDYMVSNLGNVKSLKYGKERFLKPRTDRKGYLSIALHKGKIREQWKVHRLVATYFVSNPNNYTDVNHIDEDKTNNCADNLEWCDKTYNNNYGHRNKNISIKNKNHPSLSKKVAQYDKNGNLIKIYPSTLEAERQLGITSIAECCRGGRFSKERGKWVNVNYVYGFHFEYIED